MCESGRSSVNVGIVDVDDDLHFVIINVTEERALADKACIEADRASISVEEYLEFAVNNCVGEDPETCSINGAGKCTCSSMPTRCIDRDFKSALSRCEDISS